MRANLKSRNWLFLFHLYFVFVLRDMLEVKWKEFDLKGYLWYLMNQFLFENPKL